MAGVTAKYGSLKFENVAGYRIAAQLSPAHGFQGRFYVYIFEKTDANYQRQHVSVGTPGDIPKDTLTIADKNRNYEFKDISLISVETGVTRTERYRLLEFRYYREVTGHGGAVPATIENNDPRELMRGGPADDYKLKLDDDAEFLLGFTGRQMPDEPVIFRWSTYRNKSNSWIKKVIEMNDAIVTENKSPEFAVNFRDVNIEAKDGNLELVMVDESYGEMLKYPMASFYEIATSADEDDLARVNLQAYSTQELVVHNKTRGFTSAVEPSTIETATVRFAPGYYFDVELI